VTLDSSNQGVITVPGDNRKTAEAVAKELKIDRVMAELAPKEKNEIVRTLRNEKKSCGDAECRHHFGQRRPARNSQIDRFKPSGNA
jgi:hypothetical protein